LSVRELSVIYIREEVIVMCFAAIGLALGATKAAAVSTGIAATSAAVGIGSAGLSYAGQRQQARQQAKFQAQAQAAERQRFLQEQTSLRMRQAQEQEAVGRELEQVSRKSQAALARARVSAGEAGVAGASVQALMDDYMRQEAGYRAAILRQQELGSISTGLGLEQAGFATQQRMIGLSQPIEKPSFLTAGLSALSGGLSGMRTGLDISSRMGGGGATGSLADYTSTPRQLGSSDLTLSGGYYIPGLTRRG
jgi:hypothetical protein